MRIIDTHLHLIYPDQLSYPWLSDVLALNKAYSLDNYQAEAKPLGIKGALHMEVDVTEANIEAETRFATSLPAPVIGAIAACRPEAGDFETQFDRLNAIPNVQGFRHILHTSPDELSQSEHFAQNVRHISKAGKPFDLTVLARQLLIPLVERCPDAQFILDHCSVPDVARQALDPWRADIKAMARLPNVAVKLSGIIAYAGPDWTLNDLRLFAEHVIDCFGFDRVVWSSDAPVCSLTANLTRWVEATHELLAGCSDDEKTAVLSGNAERIYGL